MMEAAEDYFNALEETPDQDETGIAVLRQRLDQLQHLYADNPAYAAFLRMHAPKAQGDE